MGEIECEKPDEEIKKDIAEGRGALVTILRVTETSTWEDRRLGYPPEMEIEAYLRIYMKGYLVQYCFPQGRRWPKDSSFPGEPMSIHKVTVQSLDPGEIKKAIVAAWKESVEKAEVKNTIVGKTFNLKEEGPDG